MENGSGFGWRASPCRGRNVAPTGAAFTVVAWAFAYAYSVVQVLWPDSFSSPSGSDQSWFELLYLSFSVLTSVGPLLSQVQDGIGLSSALAGVLTTLPVVAFASATGQAPVIPSPPASLTGENPGRPGMCSVISAPMNRAQVSVPPPSARGMSRETVSPA